MTYQAVIRNASNNLVVSAPVKMKISILQGSISGTAVYSELHNPTTNANGLVSIEIGSGTSPVGTIGSINWGNGTYFLKTETDPTNGTNYTILGISQLLSVPYAFHSGNGVKGVSTSGDTLFLSNGEKYIIPGIKKVSDAPPTLNNGLVASYPFNGNANDESGNNNNGTVNGATLTTDRFGNLNKAYSFSGINTSIIVPHNNTLNLTSFTICSWIRVSNLNNSFYQILTKGGDLDENYEQLMYGNPFPQAGGVECAIVGTNGIRGYTIEFDDAAKRVKTNIWTSVITVYNLSNGKLRTYIGGILQLEATPNITPKFNNTPLNIGRDPSVGRNFSGLIDDIRIYNRALTQEEITYLANN
jgi:hypothetical protein